MSLESVQSDLQDLWIPIKTQTNFKAPSQPSFRQFSRETPGESIRKDFICSICLVSRVILWPLWCISLTSAVKLGVLLTCREMHWQVCRTPPSSPDKQPISNLGLYGYLTPWLLNYGKIQSRVPVHGQASLCDIALWSFHCYVMSQSYCFACPPNQWS